MFYRQTIALDPANYPHPVKISKISASGHYLDQAHLLVLNSNGNVEGCCYITAIPHCCGMLFLSDINSYCPAKGGVGQRVLAMALRFREIGGYSSMQCVVAKPKCREERYLRSYKKICHILRKAGFKPVTSTSFVNARTGNRCTTWVWKEGKQK